MTTEGTAIARLVLKVSGASLGGERSLDPVSFKRVVEHLRCLEAYGIACAVVVGGGNFMRGPEHVAWGIKPISFDMIAMRATAINASLLHEMAQDAGLNTSLLTRSPCNEMDISWTPQNARNMVASATIAILAGGSGEPGMSTDVPTVELARDIDADAIVMLKNGVDAIYDRDPNSFPDDARPLRVATASELLEKELKIMDRIALQGARQHGIPIIVISANRSHAVKEWLDGGKPGTYVVPR